jgi:multicomponent Na+:H+ antiporter subunit G
MTPGLVFEIFRFGLGGLIAAAGLAVMIGGTLGMLRFPDFYTRLHGARVADALGAVVVLLGLAVIAWDGAIAVRLLLLAALIIALAPTLAQLAAGAAHAGGLAPLAGPYTAPRPGRPRADGPT